jgi:hypothetical protein
MSVEYLIDISRLVLYAGKLDPIIYLSELIG